MKKILAIVMTLVSLSAAAQTQEKDSVANDSVNITRIKTLEARRDSLQKLLAIEDAKRNVSRPGVRPATLERINNRQDSICLALRSELTDINLEIKELTPAPTVSSQIVQQFNTTLGSKENNTPDTNSKPTQTAINPKRKKK